MAGQMVHLEIPAGDTAKAREFWGGLFGWEFQAFEGSPTEYHMTRFSETTGGAIMERDDSVQGPRVYFDVDDINAGASRVKELGGEASDAMPVPSMGWFATCKDTDGNDFGLWQHDRVDVVTAAKDMSWGLSLGHVLNGARLCRKAARSAR